MMKTVAENPDLPALKTRNINGQVSKADIILRSWKLPPILFAEIFELDGWSFSANLFIFKNFCNSPKH